MNARSTGARWYARSMSKLVAAILAAGVMTGCFVTTRGSRGGNGCGPGYHWNGGGCERDYARHDDGHDRGDDHDNGRRGNDNDKDKDKDKGKDKDKDNGHDNGRRGHD